MVIATPDHWHTIIAIAALNAGKDVYCEKPMSHTVIEGRAMVQARRANKRIFQVGSMQRSMGEFREACELVRNGVIGTVAKVDASVAGPPVFCNLVNMVYFSGKGLKWNPAKEVFADGTGDASWLTREYRAPLIFQSKAHAFPAGGGANGALVIWLILIRRATRHRYSNAQRYRPFWDAPSPTPPIRPVLTPPRRACWGAVHRLVKMRGFFRQAK